MQTIFEQYKSSEAFRNECLKNATCIGIGKYGKAYEFFYDNVRYWVRNNFDSTFTWL